jgi:hypothetical protein
MDIKDALDSAQIAYHLDTRAKYRVSSGQLALIVKYVSGDSSSATVEEAVSLDPCPLVLVTASGRVLVLGSGLAGTIAVEGVDSANKTQTDILKQIGKAAWETLKVPFLEFYEAPTTGRKRPKAEPVVDPAIDEVAEEPVQDSSADVDITEPSE